MKIMVLNGSPRPKGNTAALVAAFTEGAESAGHEVTSFMLDKMKINGCKGCYGANKNPDSPCVQKDDMEQIYAAYKDSDVVVMASPLYFWTLSGQLRTALDRLFAPMEKGAHPDKKGCVLLMAAGEEDFGFCQAWFDDVAGKLGWKNYGSLLVGGVNNIGDINGRPELEQARRLGASIA